MQYACSTSGVAYFILLQAENERRPQIRISRDDNSVIIFKYIINCGRLCPFTDTSLCRLGRYRLQIWEEPLRNLVTWFVHNATTLYAHNCQTVLARTRNTPVRFSLVRAMCPNQKKERSPGYSAARLSLFQAHAPEPTTNCTASTRISDSFLSRAAGSQPRRRPRPKY